VTRSGPLRRKEARSSSPSVASPAPRRRQKSSSRVAIANTPSRPRAARPARLTLRSAKATWLEPTHRASANLPSSAKRHRWAGAPKRRTTFLLRPSIESGRLVLFRNRQTYLASTSDLACCVDERPDPGNLANLRTQVTQPSGSAGHVTVAAHQRRVCHRTNACAVGHGRN